jgi:delta 1-pyrroline-5-carboxylate dehydrogenase
MATDDASSEIPVDTMGKQEAPAVEAKHEAPTTESPTPAATNGESAKVPIGTNGKHGAVQEPNGHAKDESIYVIPMQIGGKDVHTSSTFDVISPATGKLLHKCVSATVEDAIKAVEAAEKAFPAWRDTLPGKKRDIFLKAAGILDKRAQELGKYMEDETGAAEFWSSGFNVPVASDGLRDLAGRISSLSGTIPTIANEGRSALIYKEPYGVILGIAPWYVAKLILISKPLENCPCDSGFRACTDMWGASQECSVHPRFPRHHLRHRSR